MQVNSSNGSLQNRYFSGTGSIGGIHLPDFNDKYVFSKKKSSIRDEEYRKQIREQAYEDFAKGQFQNKSEEFNRLMKSYTSEVSPDRKGIITSGLKAVSKNRQNVLKPIEGNKTHTPISNSPTRQGGHPRRSGRLGNRGAGVQDYLPRKGGNGAYGKITGAHWHLPIAPHLLFPQFLNEGIEEVDPCQYFGQKKLKDYAVFSSSSSSFCWGVM